MTTNTSFSIYHTSWITSGPKSNFFVKIWRQKAILFFSGCSEVNSTVQYLANHLRASQSARREKYYSLVWYILSVITLFTCWASLQKFLKGESDGPSRCFQLSTNPDKDFFVIFDIVVIKQIGCGLAWSVLLSPTIRVIAVVKICCGLTRRGLVESRQHLTTVACEQAHLFGNREPAKPARRMWRGHILLASSRLQLPYLCPWYPYKRVSPARRLWPLWWRVPLSIRVQTTLNHIRFVKDVRAQKFSRTDFCVRRSGERILISWWELIKGFYVRQAGG